MVLEEPTEKERGSHGSDGVEGGVIDSDPDENRSVGTGSSQGGHCTSPRNQKVLDSSIELMTDAQEAFLSPKKWIESVIRESRRGTSSEDEVDTPEAVKRGPEDVVNTQDDSAEDEYLEEALQSRSKDMRRVQSAITPTPEDFTERDISTWEMEGEDLQILGTGHYVLLDREILMSFEEAFNYLFEDSAESCIFRKWHRARGTANLNVFPWKDIGKCNMRSVSYRAFGNDPILRNGFEVVEEWYCRTVEGIGYVVDVDISTPFLPYGKNYVVRESFCLAGLGEKKTRIKLVSTVVFLKSTMSFIQGKIVKHAKMGSTRSSCKLVETLEEEEEHEKAASLPCTDTQTETVPSLDLRTIKDLIEKGNPCGGLSTRAALFAWFALFFVIYFWILKTQLDGLGNVLQTLQSDLAQSRMLLRYIIESLYRVVFKPNFPDSLDEFVWSLIPAYMLIKLWEKVSTFSFHSSTQISFDFGATCGIEDILQAKDVKVTRQLVSGKTRIGRRTAKFISENKKNIGRLQTALIGQMNKLEKQLNNQPLEKVEEDECISEEPWESSDVECSTATASGEVIEGPMIEEVFENERIQPFVGWGSKYPGHLLPTDRKRWSDRSGKQSSMSFDKIAPRLPEGWAWMSDWTIDLNGMEEECVDGDGFSYGLDFWQLKYPPSPGCGHNGYSSFVRRRRWLRIRQKTA